MGHRAPRRKSLLAPAPRLQVQWGPSSARPAQATCNVLRYTFRLLNSAPSRSTSNVLRYKLPLAALNFARLHRLVSGDAFTCRQAVSRVGRRAPVT